MFTDLYQAERGENNPSVQTVCRIAVALGESPETILRDIIEDRPGLRKILRQNGGGRVVQMRRKVARR